MEKNNSAVSFCQLKVDARRSQEVPVEASLEYWKGKTILFY